jgi:hypothetical protein
VRRSKTDQEGQGREIGVPRSRKSATCPVAALEAWLELAGKNRNDRGENFPPERITNNVDGKSPNETSDMGKPSGGFPVPRLSARYRFSQGTFAGTWGNGRDAPISVVRMPADERVKSTLCRHSTGLRNRDTRKSLATAFWAASSPCSRAKAHIPASLGYETSPCRAGCF